MASPVRRLLLVALASIGREAGAMTAREGVEYSLLASDGRYLAADERGGRTVLVSPVAKFGRGGTSHFKFVRVGGSSTLVYLRFGDVLLHAPGAAAEDADDVRPAQFRLYVRPADGRVALSSYAGTLLRAGRSTVEQGGLPSDETAWWQLQALGADADCPADELGALPEPQARRLRGGAGEGSGRQSRSVTGKKQTTPRRVFARSSGLVLASTAAMLPASAWSGLVAPLAPALISPAAQAVTAVFGALPPPVRTAIFGFFGLLKGAGSSLMAMREAHAFAAVLLHGLVTDGVSDALAQAISAPDTPSPPPAGSSGGGVQKGSAKSMELDWKRVRRSAGVAFVTDDVPFALWTRYLFDLFEKARNHCHVTTM